MEVYFQSYLTSAPERGELLASRSDSFTPKKNQVLIGKEAGWAPESIQTFWRREKKLFLAVCLSVHRCICVEKKNQLDVTEWFIALIICSTCFGHFYAHHQELETICVYYTAYGVQCLAAGCPGRGMLQSHATSLFLDA